MRYLKTITALIFLFTFSLGMAQAQPDYDYLIIVSDRARTLLLYEAGNEQEVLAVYLIGVPKKKYYELPLCGEVKGVEFNPAWWPTKKTRAAYFKSEEIVLPEKIEPGDPRNAMGKAKLNLQLEGISEPIKIHGTNKPSSIGKKVSRGCIRMHNESVLELAHIIKNARTKVVFEK